MSAPRFAILKRVSPCQRGGKGGWSGAWREGTRRRPGQLSHPPLPPLNKGGKRSMNPRGPRSSCSGSVGKGDWLRAESCEILEIFEVPPGACPLFRQSLVTASTSPRRGILRTSPRSVSPRGDPIVCNPVANLRLFISPPVPPLSRGRNASGPTSPSPSLARRETCYLYFFRRRSGLGVDDALGDVRQFVVGGLFLVEGLLEQLLGLGLAEQRA